MTNASPTMTAAEASLTKAQRKQLPKEQRRRLRKIRRAMRAQASSEAATMASASAGAVAATNGKRKKKKKKKNKKKKLPTSADPATAAVALPAWITAMSTTGSKKKNHKRKHGATSQSDGNVRKKRKLTKATPAAAPAAPTFQGGSGNRVTFSRKGGKFVAKSSAGGAPDGGGRRKMFQKDFYTEHAEVSAMTEKDVEGVREKLHITVTGENVPKPLSKFYHAGFPEKTMEQLTQAGFAEPSPIQQQAWPMALSGRDVIGIAQTGSGKTLAFLLPAVVHINAQPPLKEGDGPIALIVAPTRELATQIEQEAKKFSAGLRVACVYGGAPRWKQQQILEAGVEIVAATPGRLLDFLESEVTELSRVTYLVMDEADRMLDMGFEPDIRRIVSQVRDLGFRQTLMFSATWPKSVQKLASQFMHDPIKVVIGGEGLKANKAVTQRVERVDEVREKTKRLLEILKTEVKEDRALIFVLYKKNCASLERELWNRGFNCKGICGDKSQQQRESALQAFKDGNIQFLIGTDVASRGLHMDGIKWVINYDFPLAVEDYVHRIGRTGRAGATGTAITFMCKRDNRHVRGVMDIIEDAGQDVPDCLRKMLSIRTPVGGW